MTLTPQSIPMPMKCVMDKTTIVMVSPMKTMPSMLSPGTWIAMVMGQAIPTNPP